MPRRVRAQDVADRAGVSRTTVSFVLNGRDAGIPPETCERVRRCAAELGYIPSAPARALRKGSSDVVLILTGQQVTEVGESLWDHLTSSFQAHKLTTVFSRTAGITTPLRQLLEQIRPHAVVALISLDDADIELLKQLDVPLLSVVHSPLPPDHNSPGTQPAAALHQLQEAVGDIQARYLLSQGYRRLLYVTDPRVISQAPVLDVRRTSFAQTVQRTPGASITATISISTPDTSTAVADLERALRPHIASPQCPDAIAAFNDDLAGAVLRALSQLQVRVPEDVAVIGVDNLRLGQYLSPALTSIALDPDHTWADYVAGSLVAALTRAHEMPPEPSRLARVVVRDSA